MTKEDNIQFRGGRLEIQYIPISEAVKWEWRDNPKKHEIEKLKGAIVKHGFRDAPIFDESLDPPGFAAGNGRTKALFYLWEEFAAGVLDKIPNGVGVIESGDREGEWALPVQMGVNSVSARMAESFAVDHNNLTVVGFSDEEIALIWDAESYARVLARISEDDEAAPVSVSERAMKSLESGNFLKDVQALVEDREGKPESTTPEGEDMGPDFDQADLALEEYQVELGQVWELGDHKLAVGDSRDGDLLRILMGRTKADLILSDPPYGLGKESEGVANDNLYNEKLDRFQMEWWAACRPFLADNASAYIFGQAADLWRLWYLGGLGDSEVLTLRNEIVWDKAVEGVNPSLMVSGVPFEAQRKYFETERALFFMIGAQGFNTNSENYWEGWEPLRSYLAGEVEKMGWGPGDIKEITGVGMFGHWFTKSQWVFIPEDHYRSLQAAADGAAFVDGYGEHEEVYQSLKRDFERLKREFYESRAYFDNTHSKMTDVFRFPRVEGEARRGHPTPKNLALIERMILSSSRERDLILSPFVGSGTDIVAAERLKRRCRAVEISPKWAAVALARWADNTGKRPVLVNS